MNPGAVALTLSQRIKPLLAGHPQMIQGATLADLVSIFIAGHRPDLREDALNHFIEVMRKLVPVSEVEIFPNGMPEGWKPQ